jgi:hypothetical protein
MYGSPFYGNVFLENCVSQEIRCIWFFKGTTEWRSCVKIYFDDDSSVNFIQNEDGEKLL